MPNKKTSAENWMNSKWRPMMGWMYMAVCFFDFVLAPILWSVVQALYKGNIIVQWQPLTLQGAGLFHISMGAVLGVSAWGRTQEKLNDAITQSITVPTNVGTTYEPTAAMPTAFASSDDTAPVSTTTTN